MAEWKNINATRRWWEQRNTQGNCAEHEFPLKHNLTSVIEQEKNGLMTDLLGMRGVGTGHKNGKVSLDLWNRLQKPQEASPTFNLGSSSDQTFRAGVAPWTVQPIPRLPAQRWRIWNLTLCLRGMKLDSITTARDLFTHQQIRWLLKWQMTSPHLHIHACCFIRVVINDSDYPWLLITAATYVRYKWTFLSPDMWKSNIFAGVWRYWFCARKKKKAPASIDKQTQRADLGCWSGVTADLTSDQSSLGRCLLLKSALGFSGRNQSGARPSEGSLSSSH